MLRTYCVEFLLNRNFLTIWLLSLLTLFYVVNASVNYNTVYNEAVDSKLKQAIQKELPKEAKFFDELDCK